MLVNMPTEVVDSGHSTKDVLDYNDLLVITNGNNVDEGGIKVKPKTEEDFKYDMVKESGPKYTWRQCAGLFSVVMVTRSDQFSRKKRKLKNSDLII